MTTNKLNDMIKELKSLIKNDYKVYGFGAITYKYISVRDVNKLIKKYQ